MADLLFKMKQGLTKIKNKVMNVSPIEALTLEATNDDTWGASGTQLGEIADGTQDREQLQAIMAIVFKRLDDSGKKWRRVYKAMNLIEYLVKHGSERCVDYARDQLYKIRTLHDFQFIDETGKDEGVNVREKSKKLVKLLNDTDAIREERKKARENKDRFKGISSDEVGGGGGSRYGGGGSYGGYDDDDGHSSRDRDSGSRGGGGSFRDEPAPRAAAAAPRGGAGGARPGSAAQGGAARRHAPNPPSDDESSSEDEAPRRAPAQQQRAAPAQRSAPSANARQNLFDDDFSAPAAPKPAQQQQRRAAPADDSAFQSQFEDWNAFDSPSAAPKSSNGGARSGGASAGGFGDFGGFDDFKQAPARPAQQQQQQQQSRPGANASDLFNLGGSLPTKTDSEWADFDTQGKPQQDTIWGNFEVDLSNKNKKGGLKAEEPAKTKVPMRNLVGGDAAMPQGLPPGAQPPMMGMQAPPAAGMMGQRPMGMMPGAPMMGMQPGMMGMQPGMMGMQPGMMGMQPGMMGMQPGMMGMQPGMMGMQPGMMGMQPGMMGMQGGMMGGAAGGYGAPAPAPAPAPARGNDPFGF